MMRNWKRKGFVLLLAVLLLLPATCAYAMEPASDAVTYEAEAQEFTENTVVESEESGSLADDLAVEIEAAEETVEEALQTEENPIVEEEVTTENVTVLQEEAGTKEEAETAAATVPSVTTKKTYFAKAKTPVITKYQKGFQISWKRTKKASGYQVYKRQTGQTKWERLKTVKKHLYCYDQNVKTGISYDYLVLPYQLVNGKKDYASWNEKSWASAAKLAEPKLTGIRSGDGGLTIAWNSVGAAKQYRIYRSTQPTGPWKYLGKTKKLTYTDTAAANGTHYYYTVAAQNGAWKSARGASYRSGVYLPAPKMKKCTYEPQGIRINWKKLKGAFGYRVYRIKKNGKFSYIGSTAGTSLLDTSAKVETDYRYTVRAYSRQTTKCYSEYNKKGVAARMPDLANKFVQDPNNVVIMINAGHDIDHPGCANGNYREYLMTLKIAKACKAELETYQNVTVLMTRTNANCPHKGTSEAVDLIRRVRTSKERGADVYVSIHINAGAGNALRGIWVLPQMQTKTWRPYLGRISNDLGESMRKELVKLGFQNGITYRRQNTNVPQETYPDGTIADYYSELYTGMMYDIPTVIMEHGFIDNADLKLLNSNAKLKAVGIADATGIANYYGLKKK